MPLKPAKKRRSESRAARKAARRATRHSHHGQVVNPPGHDKSRSRNAGKAPTLSDKPARR